LVDVLGELNHFYLTCSMKTVGRILFEARKRKGIKLKIVAEATKIRPRFLKAIETNDFAKLPSSLAAHGFIKNYADFLGVPPKFALAVFRRDFASDEKGKIVPRGLVKPLDSPKFFTSPRVGLYLVTVVFIVGILFYLLFQYSSLIRGPFLEVDSPEKQAEVLTDPVGVAGRTEPDATVKVNGGLINVFPDGHFYTTVSLRIGKNLIVIEAANKMGKIKRVVREVFQELPTPS